MLWILCTSCYILNLFLWLDSLIKESTYQTQTLYVFHCKTKVSTLLSLSYIIACVFLQFLVKHSCSGFATNSRLSSSQALCDLHFRTFLFQHVQTLCVSSSLQILLQALQGKRSCRVKERSISRKKKDDQLICDKVKRRNMWLGHSSVAVLYIYQHTVHRLFMHKSVN